MRDITVIQAKRYGTFTCTTTTKLLDAARLMVDEDISGLVIMDDEGNLAGILTRSDLLRAYTTDADWASQTAEAYMNREVITVSPRDRLSYVANLLLEHRIHRAVVVHKELGKRRPIGVISDSDLVYHMIKDVDK